MHDGLLMLSSLVSSPFPALVFDCLQYAIVCYFVQLCAVVCYCVLFCAVVCYCVHTTSSQTLQVCEAKLYDVITSNGMPADAKM